MADQPIALPDFSRGTVHHFDRAGLDDIVSRTIGQVPAGKPWIVGFGVDKSGASVGVVFSFDTGRAHWEPRAAFGWTPDGGLTGFGSVTIAPK